MNIFTDVEIFPFFFKLFSVVISIIYLFISVIVLQQMKAMRRSVRIRDKGMLRYLAYINIVIAALAVLCALFIL